MTISRKYLFRIIAWFFGILLFLYLAVFVYVIINKQKILEEVTHEISKKVKGNLTIAKASLSFFSNFPSVAVMLEKVTLNDSMFHQHRHTFFQAEKVYLKLDIIKLYKKQPGLKGINIEEGNICLFTDSTGYSNKYLMKFNTSSTPKSNKRAVVGPVSVLLRQVSLVIDDRPKNKLHDLVVNLLDLSIKENDNAEVLISAKTDILVNELSFKRLRGSYLKHKSVKGDFDLVFNQRKNQLLFNEAQFRIAAQPFTISGLFELTGNQPVFNLKLDTEKIGYTLLKTLLPGRISRSLAVVAIDKPIDAHADITGQLKGGDPLVLIDFAVNHTSLKTSFFDFDDAGFAGSFTNEVVPGLPRKDPNSRIRLKHFNGTWRGIKVRSDSLEILNLSTPTLACDFHSEFLLTEMNEHTGIHSLNFTSGRGTVHGYYHGPVQRNAQTNAMVDAVVTIDSASVTYLPKSLEMKSVSGKIILKNADLTIENLQANILNHQLFIQAGSKNLLTLMNSNPAEVMSTVSIYTPSLNFNALRLFMNANNKPGPVTQKKQPFLKITSNLDHVLAYGKMQVNLTAGKLYYEKFLATEVKAGISLLPDKYQINAVNMRHAGGNMAFTGTVQQERSNQHQVIFSTAFTNVDVKQLFRAFDNFGQDAIKSENLGGRLTTKLNGTLRLNNNGRIIPASIRSMIDFSLKNGELNDYDPVKKLQLFIFKNRDFENLRFAELKNKLIVSNQEIRINRMEIQSNVISMFVEGIYSKKGNTDISIQLPLSNLKKRGASFNPKNMGLKKKTGASIFLRGRPGSDGNIDFTYDILKKYQKEKAAKAALK